MMSTNICSPNHKQPSALIPLLLLVTVIQCFYFCATTVEAIAAVKLPPGKAIPGLIGFGDSIIDPGNNNAVKTLIKCNFPPYGRDFNGGQPTGRFSNGKIPTDLIVQALGIKQNLPAYLDPNVRPEEYLTGVSFASGAAGFDPLTSKIASAIPLTAQLDMFKDYISKLTSMVGPDRTNFILSNSVILVVAGSDDIANTYFDTPFRRIQYDYESYTDLMLREASSFLRQLHALGVRRIGVFSAPPIGCVPSQRTLGGGLLRSCASKYNQVAVMFNRKLERELGTLGQKLGGGDTKVVYVDIYKPLLDIIENPQKYGIEVVNKGCCGTGIIEVSVLCNKLGKVCEDDEKYLFWDSYHPTQKGYEILSQGILNTYISELS